MRQGVRSAAVAPAGSETAMLDVIGGGNEQWQPDAANLMMRREFLERSERVAGEVGAARVLEVIRMEIRVSGHPDNERRDSFAGEVDQDALSLARAMKFGWRIVPASEHTGERLLAPAAKTSSMARDCARLPPLDETIRSNSGGIAEGAAFWTRSSIGPF